MKRFVASLSLVAALLIRTPVAAQESTESQQYTAGQQVQATDLSGDFEAVRNLAGILATLVLGNKNALPNQNPLQVTLSPSNLTFSVGGSGQFVIAQDVAASGNARIVDSCPQQTITIPANNTTSTRVDLLSIQYQQIPTNAHNVAFNDGTVRTVYNAYEGCSYSYNAGTTTPPAGYVAFAQISVPGGSTSSSQASVTYLFKSVEQLLQQQLGNVVSSIDGASGTVNLVGGGGIAITNLGNNTLQVSANIPSAVTALDGETGPIAFTSVDGSITVTQNGPNGLNIKANFPSVVNSLNGATGNMTIQAGSGIQVTTGGSVIGITNTGVTSLTSSDGSVSVSGSTGNVNLKFAANHIFGGNVVTGSNSEVTVTVPYVVIGATGNLGVNTGQTNPYLVVVDQQASNFSAGRVVFEAINLGAGSSAPSLIGAGAGVFYTIATTAAPHS